MRYLTKIPIRLKTPDGEVGLKPGDIFKPKSEEAIKELLAEGIIKPYCYWLADVIEDCQPPCFHMTDRVVRRECKSFKEYWRKRLEAIGNGKA
jgi:hypothetical protein